MTNAYPKHQIFPEILGNKKHEMGKVHDKKLEQMLQHVEKMLQLVFQSNTVFAVQGLSIN
jgi:hypothetical protein